MSDGFNGTSESLRRLEEGMRRLEAGLLPPRPRPAAAGIPIFSGNFSGPTLLDDPVGSKDMRREVSDLRTELDALAAKVRFQSQVQHDQAQVQQDQAGRIAALERGSGKGGRL